MGVGNVGQLSNQTNAELMDDNSMSLTLSENCRGRVVDVEEGEQNHLGILR